MIEKGLRLAIELVLVEQQAEQALRFAADENILRDSQMIHQLQFLMNDPDSRRLSLARTGEINRSTIVENGPAVFGVDAGEDFHQRRFAGAVLAHQSMDLARHEFEAHAVQRSHAGEGLTDIRDGDQRVHGTVRSLGEDRSGLSKPTRAGRSAPFIAVLAFAYVMDKKPLAIGQVNLFFI